MVLGTLAVVLVGPHAAGADEGTPPAPAQASYSAPPGLGDIWLGPVPIDPIDVGGTVDALIGGVTGAGNQNRGSESGTGTNRPDPIGATTSVPSPSAGRHRTDQPPRSTGVGTRHRKTRTRSMPTQRQATSTTGTVLPVGHQGTTKQFRAVEVPGAGARSGARLLNDPPGSPRVLHRVSRLTGDALSAPADAGTTIVIVLGVATVLAAGVLVLFMRTGRRSRPE